MCIHSSLIQGWSAGVALTYVSPESAVSFKRVYLTCSMSARESAGGQHKARYVSQEVVETKTEIKGE